MILTLCGSARFESTWHEANKQLGLAGHICFSLMTFPSIEKSKTWYTPDQKWTLDLAHFSKIEESDGAVFLNVGGYLGESSFRELTWARMRGKLIFFLEFKEANLYPYQLKYNDDRHLMELIPLEAYEAIKICEKK